MFAWCLALVIAAATSITAQSQTPPEESTRPKLSPAEIFQLQTQSENGDASAQLALGKAYEFGNGVTQNDELAVKWYRKAAEQGNATAENNLGVMYRTGSGVERDKEEAVRWYHKAAKLGNLPAMFNLGTAYYNGDGVPSDPTMAYSWFLLAQEGGYPAAQDAVRRSAAEFGESSTYEATFQVGAMYEKGDQLPVNYAEAAKWYRRAAERGSVAPMAKVRLAALLLDGQGVQQDRSEALNLCRSAAQDGYAQGQFCVGYIYQQGLGLAKDPKEASKWYQQAANRVHAQSALRLADMNINGEGVDIDRAEAYCLFVAAYRGGATSAKAQTQLLLKDMSKGELKRLEKKLRERRLDPKKVFAIMQDQTSDSAPRKRLQLDGAIK